MSWSVEASLSRQPRMNSSLSHSSLTAVQLDPFSLRQGARQGECLWCTVSTKPGTTEVMTRPRTLHSRGCITQPRLLLRTCALHSKPPFFFFYFWGVAVLDSYKRNLVCHPSGRNTSSKAALTQNEQKTRTFSLCCSIISSSSCPRSYIYNQM